VVGGMGAGPGSVGRDLGTGATARERWRGVRRHRRYNAHRESTHLRVIVILLKLLGRDLPGFLLFPLLCRPMDALRSRNGKNRVE
jgi:hypothetical protein